MTDFNQYRQQIELRGEPLSYLDMGQGPVLLLGHSYLWDATMWQQQLPVLAKHYRCIVPDLWGHGQSGAIPAHTESLADIAADMLTLMDKLSVDEFTVIGLSVGAMWGAELVLKAPSRVKALVMMGSFLGFEPEVTRNKYMAMLDGISQLGQIPAPMAEQIAPMFFAVTTASLRPQLLSDFASALQSISPERIPDTVAMGKLIFNRRDAMEDANNLTLPCLIMSGVEDTARTVLESFLMVDAIDGAEMVQIPAAGHISVLEQGDFINQALLTFLEKHH
ncbi:alpha/beta hydrolase [Shewanella algae]|uniref:alpha/beta fold hydrolase n=1 Tax=Shewanella algae TaxID=38313 RepID=UPI00222E34D0|nr:alpha/beta hydrolase [Shewanella algae]UZD56694.1 alpha/beta hydrolase [Shewanella algae]